MLCFLPFKTVAALRPGLWPRHGLCSRRLDGAQSNELAVAGGVDCGSHRLPRRAGVGSVRVCLVCGLCRLVPFPQGVKPTRRPAVSHAPLPPHPIIPYSLVLGVLRLLLLCVREWCQQCFCVPCVDRLAVAFLVCRTFKFSGCPLPRPLSHPNSLHPRHSTCD